jgi:hypothetical protein
MILVYTEIISARLQYITDFIFTDIFKTSFQLTTNKEDFKKINNLKINYSHEKKISDNEFWIKPHSLLFEKGIKLQKTDCFIANGQKVFFKTEGDLSFDIFAASFYLLSRYEEYLPHKNDTYGRYAHENSLADKENFLQLPLINIWMNEFKKSLQNKFSSLVINNLSFTFLPTYDIDQAWSYLHKSWFRDWGGAIKNLVKGKISNLNERLKVKRQKQKDPFDAYDWIDELHRKYDLKPIYFFHVAKANGRYDKNILPDDPKMQELVKQHSQQYNIGIHPSWRSGDEPDLVLGEIQTLQNITGKKVTSSRQHYIRFTLPQTFRKLIEAGVTDDYSMGYGSINGFRASVASSFYWYDLEKEEKTNLLLHPFCFMEANSFFEQKFSVQQALEELRHYKNVIQTVNGTMITIWHNSFLGTEKTFAGWKDIYEQFIKEISITAQ